MRIRNIFLVLVTAAALLLASCRTADGPEPTPQPAPTPPAETPQETDVILEAEAAPDVAYGHASGSQKFDLYLPARVPDALLETDAFLLIHGGGWQSGDKVEYRPWQTELNEMGLVVASMNYRMIDEAADWEIMLLDITAALTALKQECADRGITLRSVALMGYSSGGHLALLYAFKNADVSPIPIAFCVGQAAPSALTDPNLYPENIFGDILLENIGRLIYRPFTRAELALAEPALTAASPVTYITADSVPAIFAHGTKDLTVPISNAETLDAALTAAGVPHRYVVYQDDDHGLAYNVEARNAFFAAMCEYIELYMK